MRPSMRILVLAPTIPGSTAVALTSDIAALRPTITVIAGRVAYLTDSGVFAVPR